MIDEHRAPNIRQSVGFYGMCATVLFALSTGGGILTPTPICRVRTNPASESVGT